ncbi:hypothetical protein [Flavobacterium davisii]|uniref:Uncharacterized protein n=1 Tax=Flavobacterium columnare TaxID=996 RepID=A0A8G0KVM6_9FLAO|nr:hypothetical protein [Flavobacterium davisii]QYS88450.1 hypothetical protein JJC05_12345 [Flavobacterium davisii]
MNNYQYKLVIKESNFVCGEKVSNAKILKFTNALVASNEVFVDKGGSVLGNDILNGVPATLTTAIVTPITNGPLSVDASGNLTVAPKTAPGDLFCSLYCLSNRSCASKLYYSYSYSYY